MHSSKAATTAAAAATTAGARHVAHSAAGCRLQSSPFVNLSKPWTLTCASARVSKPNSTVEPWLGAYLSGHSTRKQYCIGSKQQQPRQHPSIVRTAQTPYRPAKMLAAPCQRRALPAAAQQCAHHGCTESGSSVPALRSSRALEGRLVAEPTESLLQPAGRAHRLQEAARAATQERALKTCWTCIRLLLWTPGGLHGPKPELG